MAAPAANYRMDSDEEALFRSYPYAVYFVQSPSAISHATNNYNYEHSSPINPTRDQEATRNSTLSRYSSSRGSNNSSSFMQENNNKKKVFPNNDINVDDHLQEHGLQLMEINGTGEKYGSTAGLLMNMKNNIDDFEDEDDGDFYDDEKIMLKRSWIKYFSLSYSNSVWWILLQLSWRFLLSLTIGLLVFYVAANPPNPGMSIKIARIQQFRLGEGVDASGVTTKILSCNCSMDLIIDNKSKLFGLHIHPPIIEMFFDNLPFAISQMQGGELYAGSDGLTLFRLSVGTRNKAMYGAGRNMQDLLESGKGLPLVIKVSLRSRFHVVSGIFQPKFHHEAQCLVVLADKYDKKHRTQVYNTTCTANS